MALKFVAKSVGAFSSFYCTARFVMSVGKCEGDSMNPAIHDGDFVIHSPFPVNRMHLQKGDVVFCRSSTTPGEMVCKRLVVLDNEFIYNEKKEEKVFVKRGHIWLEGDNKPLSIDSREYGPIPYGLLYSKVLFRFWPLHRVGRISMPEDDDLR